MLFLLNYSRETFKSVLDITVESDIRGNILMKLRTVNINMDYLEIFCKAALFPVALSLKRAPSAITRSDSSSATEEA